MTFGRGYPLNSNDMLHIFWCIKKTWFNHKSNLKKNDLNCFPALQKSHQINQDHEFPNKNVRGKSLLVQPRACATRGPVFCLGGIPRFELPEHVVFFLLRFTLPTWEIPIFLNESEIWPSLIFRGGNATVRLLQLGQVEKFKWNHWHSQLKSLGSHREIPGYTRKHIGGYQVFKNKSHSECKICWSNSNISPG